MQIGYFWSIALQTSQLLETETFAIHILVGVFAATLFLLSLFAWTRRGNVGLVLVSLAFLLFAVKEVLWISETYSGYNPSIDLASTILDLLVLGFFFAAIVHRPRKQPE